ncbi:uncharacterized protein LOC102809632, partial [Saccoglossus kowalevskii]|uniref:Zinc finger protein 430-like n=1 Tax=Saccoglossus kowalevskii TaxID=10224 RepID=A0ABM0M3C5_SACKO
VKKTHNESTQTDDNQSTTSVSFGSTDPISVESKEKETQTIMITIPKEFSSKKTLVGMATRSSRRKQIAPKKAAITALRKRGRPSGSKTKTKKAVQMTQSILREETSEEDMKDDDGSHGNNEDKDYEPIKSKQNLNASLQCNICQVVFLKIIDLKHHRKIHIKEKLSCQECGKLLAGYPNLLQHVRAVHKKERPFKCDTCSKTFSSASHLTTHNEKHLTNEQKLLQCDKCEKRFAHTTSLKAHQRMSHREKLYSCETCGKSFPQKSNLVVHLRCHTGEKPYQCDECGKTFSQLSSLRSHKFIHTGEKPYKCTQCEFAFVRADDLRAHIRRHTGEKPYQCEICGKRFSKNQQLADHKRHHTGDKRYKCKLCGGTFFKSGHLKRHMTIHSGEKNYECSVCGKKVNRSDNLKTHMKIHRKDIEGLQKKEKVTSKSTMVIDPMQNVTSHAMVPLSQPTNHPVLIQSCDINYQQYRHTDTDRMFVEPIAIQSAIDTIGGLSHEQW